MRMFPSRAAPVLSENGAFNNCRKPRFDLVSNGLCLGRTRFGSSVDACDISVTLSERMSCFESERSQLLLHLTVNLFLSLFQDMDEELTPTSRKGVSDAKTPSSNRFYGHDQTPCGFRGFRIAFHNSQICTSEAARYRGLRMTAMQILQSTISIAAEGGRVRPLKLPCALSLRWQRSERPRRLLS